MTTQPPDQGNSEPGPTEVSAADTWLAGEYNALRRDVGELMDLDGGLQEILLAGQYRDLRTDLADTLDLDTGLAAIITPAARPAPQPSEYTDFTSLLDWLAAHPQLRLTHRPRLRQLSTATSILHLTRVGDHARARDLITARARDRADVLVPDRGLIGAFTGARAHLRDLIRALDRVHVRRRVRFRARNRAMDIARALERSLYLVLDRDQPLEDALDLVLILDNLLDLARARAGDPQRDLLRAHTNANALALILCELAVRRDVGALLLELNSHQSTDMSWLSRFPLDELDADRLGRLADDFAGADLRDTPLTGLDLAGVRWSQTTTLWPPTDLQWIMAASEPVEDGTYVIRDASASPGTQVAPEPGPVSV